MNFSVDEILNDLKQNQIKSGSEKCISYIDFCKNQFMEELTVNTATDYVASAILYFQFCSAEKKPWKIYPCLQDISGALRFLHDFMSDQKMLAQTFGTVAECYAFGTYFPEAAEYYWKQARLLDDKIDKENSFYYAFFYSLRGEGRVEKEMLDECEKELGKEQSKQLIKEAEEKLSTSIHTDPIEWEEEFLKIRYELEKEVDASLLNESESVPFCLRYWRCKKRICKEVFSIDWQSPEDCNPQISFQD